MVEITQSIIISVISLVILFAGYKIINKDCYVIHPIEETPKEYKSSYANNIELFKNVINMFITDNLDYNDGKFNFILNFKEITLKLDETALLYYILKSKVGTDSPNISSVKKLKKEIKPRFHKDFDKYIENYFDTNIVGRISTSEFNSFIKSIIKNKLVTRKTHDIDSYIKLKIFTNSNDLTVYTSTIKSYSEKFSIGPAHTMRLNTCGLKLNIKNAQNFGKKIDTILDGYYNYEKSDKVKFTYLSDSSKTYNNIEISIDKIGIDIYFKLNLDRSCNSLVGGSKDDWTDVLDVDGLLGEIKLKSKTINIEDLGSYIEKYLVNKKEKICIEVYFKINIPDISNNIKTNAKKQEAVAWFAWFTNTFTEIQGWVSDLITDKIIKKLNKKINIFKKYNGDLKKLNTIFKDENICDN